MKAFLKFLCVVSCLFMLGCVKSMQMDATMPSSAPMGLYETRIDTSLFDSDQEVINQEAVDRILNGTVDIEESSKIAIYKIPNRGSGISKYYGYGPWLSEEYLDLERQYFETIEKVLRGNSKVGVIKPLPSILTPKDLTLSRLREAAVRLQAKLLVIYSVQSNIFEDVKLFARNEVKAYSTCEMILFHTQTGVIPFSEVITKKVVEKQSKEDASIRETRKWAENRAILDALQELGAQLEAFL